MASVVQQNVFDLLGEGEEDIQTLAAKLPAAAKPAPKKEEAKPAARAPAPGGRGGRGEAPAARGGRGGRGAGDRIFGRGPRPATPEGGAGFDAETAPESGSGRGGRGGRGGGFRGRGRGGARRGREFERHDGTGRGHETEKRGGGGRGNWGTETEGQEPEEVEKAAAENGEEGAPAPEVAEAAEEVPAQPEEEEEVQMTLEEYEAVLAEKRAGLNKTKDPAFVADKTQFKGMKSFEKQEEDLGISLTKNAKVIGTNKAGREKERKEKEVLTDVGFRVATAEEGRGGRGGFRGGRGGRGEGRGGFRGGRGGEGRGEGRGGFAPRGRGGRGAGGAPPAVEDTNAFPSL